MTPTRLVAIAGPLGLCVALLLSCDSIVTEPSTAERVGTAAEAITAERIAASIAALAHDSARGRGTHTPELDAAAAWLAAEFDAAGLVPLGTRGFLQPFDYVARGVIGDQTFLELRDAGLETPELAFGRDFILFPPLTADTTGPLYWGGDLGASPLPPGLAAPGAIVLFDHPLPDLDRAWVGALQQAFNAIGPRRFAGVGLVLSPEIDEDDLAARRDLVGSQRYFRDPVFLLTQAAAERLVEATGTSLAALRDGPPARLADAFRVHAPPSTAVTRPSNVVAVVEGSDPSLRDSYVVLTAHYDHVGVGFPGADGDSIYNGADDNASGTAGLLEVARAMAALDTAPARSVVFLATAAEEKGLLGALHFVAAPTTGASPIIANINLDMIGRNAPNSLVGVGLDYTTMGARVDEILSQRTDLELTVRHEGGNRYFGGSDHAAFTRSAIPAVFLFAGLHDIYHTPWDETGTVDHDKAARVARLAFYLAHAVADSPMPVLFTDLAAAELNPAGASPDLDDPR